jgi:biotin operon repressor
VSEALPQLLDAKHLASELGITRAAAEKIMRQLPKVEIPDLRKVYVTRASVERLLREATKV